MTSFVGREEILNHLVCPVCFEFPEAEVFQCRDGHILCSLCYPKVPDGACPQCRIPLKRNLPIRNRIMETLLDGFRIDCPFKPNGCGKRLITEAAQAHQSECSFDFIRFGEFVNICKNIGYSTCDFKFNNGSIKEAVKHFVSMHGFALTDSARFKMSLASFKDSAVAGSPEFHFWKPIIADLKDQKCFLLMMAILNKKDACFTFLVIFLPYVTNEIQKPLVQVEYSVKTNQNEIGTGIIGIPISLSTASKTTPNRIRFTNYSPTFTKDCSEDGSLVIECNITGPLVSILKEKKEIESFVCTKEVISVQGPKSKAPTKFDSNGGSSAEKKFRTKIRSECEKNKSRLLPNLQKLFEGDKPAGFQPKDVPWLVTDLMFFAAGLWGDLDALKYLIKKGVDFNTVDEFGRAPLHYTMYGRDKQSGLEKAKLLVDSGRADVHILDGLEQTPLHYAARVGSSEAVEFFLQKDCKVNAVDKYGCAPLHLAVWSEKEETVQILLANGADPTIEDHNGNTALEFAVCEKKAKLEKLLRLHLLKEE